jgi:hypothetical protein
MRAAVLTLLLVSASQAAGPHTLPAYPIDREATFVTGPLRRDGYIDYVAAYNARRGKGVKPADNAAVLLWRAAGPQRMPEPFFAALGMKRPPAKGDYLIGFYDHVRMKEKIETDEEIEKLNDEAEQATRRPWTAKELPRVAAWLKANEKPVALVVEASKRKRCVAPVVLGYWEDRSGRRRKQRDLLDAHLTVPQSARDAAEILAARALLRAGEGRADEAWADLLACLRLGRLLGDRAGVLEMMIGASCTRSACRAIPAFLHRARPDRRRLVVMMAELRALPPMPPIADSIELDRMMLLDIMQTIHRRGLCHFGQLLDAESDLVWLLPWMWPGGMDLIPAMRSINAWQDRAAAALRLASRPEREERFKDMKGDFGELRVKFAVKDGVRRMVLGAPAERGLLAGELLLTIHGTDYKRARDRVDEAAQKLDLVLVAIALEMHHRDHDAYPKSLSVLSPKYLAKVPKDRFSGEAIKYLLDGKGYLLYSVGPDGEDHGGKTEEEDSNCDDIPLRMPPRPPVKRE